jgi:hypothetical protein
LISFPIALFSSPFLYLLRFPFIPSLKFICYFLVHCITSNKTWTWGKCNWPVLNSIATPYWRNWENHNRFCDKSFSWSAFTQLVHLTSHRTSWPKRSRPSIAFARISTVTPTSMTAVVHDFIQSFQAHVGIIP